MADPPKAKQKLQTAAQTTPEAYPTSPPQNLPSGDFTYILEIVMNMQASMGKLIEAVESLKGQSKEHEQKQYELSKQLQSVSQDVYAGKVTLKVVGALVTLTIAAVGAIAIPILIKLLDVAGEILKKIH